MIGSKEFLSVLICGTLIYQVLSHNYGGERHFMVYSRKNEPAPPNDLDRHWHKYRKWGPYPDECHVTCDEPYLMSVNFMANTQGRKLCPEFQKFYSYDDFYSATNWRMICEKKNVMLCTYCLDVTKKHIQLTAHYGSSAGHMYQLCNYTAPDPEAGGARCNQWMDLRNGTCSCKPYHGQGLFYQSDFFKNFSGFPSGPDYKVPYRTWKNNYVLKKLRHLPDYKDRVFKDK